MSGGTPTREWWEAQCERSSSIQGWYGFYNIQKVILSIWRIINFMTFMTFMFTKGTFPVIISCSKMKIIYQHNPTKMNLECHHQRENESTNLPIVFTITVIILNSGTVSKESFGLNELFSFPEWNWWNSGSSCAADGISFHCRRRMCTWAKFVKLCDFRGHRAATSVSFFTSRWSL